MYLKDTSKRQNVENSKLKIYSYNYFIEEIDGSKKQVRKKAFLSLHGVTNKITKRLQLLKVSGKSPHDMRGKSAGSRGNVVPPETCALINQFLQSMPVKETHYSNNIVKRYLSLNVSIIYQQYCQKSRYKSKPLVFQKLL